MVKGVTIVSAEAQKQRPYLHTCYEGQVLSNIEISLGHLVPIWLQADA